MYIYMFVFDPLPSDFNLYYNYIHYLYLFCISHYIYRSQEESLLGSIS